LQLFFGRFGGACRQSAKVSIPCDSNTSALKRRNTELSNGWGWRAAAALHRRAHSEMHMFGITGFALFLPSPALKNTVAAKVRFSCGKG